MRVHWLQHASFEDLGSIATWLTERGLTSSATHMYANETLPAVDTVDWLIVIGGSMNVDETAEHPWLVGEVDYIREAIAAGKRVLGICLGSQLVARALDAEVTRNPEPEIGWFDVTLTPAGRRNRWFADVPDRFPSFHWHGDTYALPSGSERLAFSDACAQQAFAYQDRVLALQFHLETMATDAARWVEAAPLPAPARYVQNAAGLLATPDDFQANNRLLAAILNRFVAES